MAREIFVYAGTILEQPRHRVNGNGPPSLSNEKTFKGLLARLFAHKARVGEVVFVVVALGDLEVVFGLAQPA